MIVVARLLGMYTHSLEQQNRLAIPAKLRSELGKSFVLTVSPSGERCLLAYKYEDWDDVMEKLNDQPSSEELTFTQRSIYLNSVSVSLDKNGRISIPIRFMEAVGLKDEVCILGTGFRLELWDQKEFEKMTEQTRARMENKKIYLNK